MAAHRVVAARVALLTQQVGDPPQRQPIPPGASRILGQQRLEPVRKGTQLWPWLHLPDVGEVRRTTAHHLAHHFARDRQLPHDFLDLLAVAEMRTPDQRNLVHPEHPCLDQSSSDRSVATGQGWGPFSTPITPLRGSLFHADQHTVISDHATVLTPSSRRGSRRTPGTRRPAARRAGTAATGWPPARVLP